MFCYVGEIFVVLEKGGIVLIIGILNWLLYSLFVIIFVLYVD